MSDGMTWWADQERAFRDLPQETEFEFEKDVEKDIIQFLNLNFDLNNWNDYIILPSRKNKSVIRFRSMEVAFAAKLKFV